MRARWRLLFWISLGSLIGLSWVAQRIGVSMWGIMTVPFLGMVFGAIVAFVAMVRNLAPKWPAVAVLVCSIPMDLDLLRAVWALPYFVNEVGFPAALFLAGAFGTIVVASFILIADPPRPPPEDPIARAQVR